MRKLFILFLVFSYMGISSCFVTTKKDESSEQEETTKKTACDEFLMRYEEWADEYFKALEEYAKNPSDEEVIIHCTELIQQAMEWSTKWVDLAECADDEEYEQRFKEISREIDKKLEELNL